MAELSGLLWWNFAYTLILTRCSPRDCQMLFGIGRGFAEVQILKTSEYIDKIMHLLCYSRELDRGIAKCHLSSVEAMPTASAFRKLLSIYVFVVSLLVLRAGYGILIIAYLFTLIQFCISITNDRRISKSNPRDCKMTSNICGGCAVLQILKKWKWPNWVDYCDKALHTH